MCLHDVLGAGPDALVAPVTFAGTASAGGGAFEYPMIMLWRFGRDGLTSGLDLFDADRTADALARFDELVSSSAEVPATGSRAVRIENAATRLSDRFTRAWEARDWDAIAATFAPGCREVDRRQMVRIELDRDRQLESLHFLFEMESSRFVEDVLATRGDRLALFRGRVEGSGGDSGPSEVDFLQVTETNGHGDAVAIVTFDPDDLEAAYAELDERYAAGEAAPHAATWRTELRFWRALAALDWERLAGTFATDFVVEDHRPVGLFTSLSRDEYVASVRALLELRPDATLRLAHVLALADDRLLAVGRWTGGEPEGAFEIPVVNAVQYGANGARRYHFYDLDQLDEARACYDALQSDPLRIPPNAATRASDRFWHCFETRDWEAAAALCAPVTWEDRRRLVRTTGGCDMAIASARLVSQAGSGVSRTLLATAGDRLMLQHLRIKGFPDGAIFEAEMVDLVEVDADGRIVALINFDPDDRRAAAAEMLERWARGDAARHIPAAVFEAFRAINDHDLDRFRATISDDFVMDDHRRTGLGRLEREDYMASLAALFEHAPGTTVEPLYHIAIEKHGILEVARNFGTLRDGGEFESAYVRILRHRGDRLVAAEMFELEHLDRARARFAELRGDLA
jgi:ketosteroid isomerase-like protein